ncbi:MAG TPA: DNA polymerase III, partial [Candidatus Parcubacteria bacterium]|nr:DNA polymerase III [Candidatus Parcubacteria bacterium]
MANKELAKIFYEISDYLKMDNIPFKPAVYRRAALTIDGLEEDIEAIYKKKGLNGLKDIPGIGESIALKIEEFLKTGKIKYYEKFKKRMPLNLEELTSVEGLGPRKAKILYEKLGIKSLSDLEKAAKSHKISKLFGFGDKEEENILEGIQFLKKSRGRFLLGYI